jgi:hypothetical protein
MTPGTSPPRPQLALCVGVTGHRELAARAQAALSSTIGGLLTDLASVTRALHGENVGVFAPDEAAFYLLSGLAIGTDQMAAGLGLAGGYALRAVLPFAPAVYRKDFRGRDARVFDALLAQSQAWSLPPQDGPRETAYACGGESTVAQSDLLVAVWDGEPARGRGGTADVIEYAVRRGVPVIWIPADGVSPPCVLWAGFEGWAPDRLDRDCVPRRLLDAAVLRQLAEAVLAPPKEADERACVAWYLSERQPRWRWRMEYPVLMALVGAPLRPARWGGGEAWQTFRDQPVAGSDAAAGGLAVLEDAFVWADGLADHVAQSYRSGLVFNYVAAAASVLVALLGIVLPQARIALELCELVLIGLLILNTSVGARRQWHRRWLNYRYLAEQLRPLRSLKLMGAATPPRQIAATVGPAGRWTDWYARAIWRQMGPPPTLGSPQVLSELVAHIAGEELDSQVRYNAANAERMHRADHRLHLLGTALFVITVGVGVASLVGLLLGGEGVYRASVFSILVSAGLPTVGAALFGIRGQGDFVGAAGRSSETEARLRAAAATLRSHPTDLMLSCRAAENAAATMLSDLTDWRTAYRHRKLAIPA